jgi:hypothetical protein
MKCVSYFRDAKERKKAIAVIFTLGAMATIAIIGAICVALIGKYNHDINLKLFINKVNQTYIKTGVLFLVAHLNFPDISICCTDNLLYL